MKYLIYSILSIMLFVGMFLCLEYDFRTNNNHVLGLLSPIQWMAVLFMFWITVILLNICFAYALKRVHKASSLLFYIESDDECQLYVIPFMQVIVLLNNLFCWLAIINGRINDEEKKQRDFDEEFNKNTIASKN